MHKIAGRQPAEAEGERGLPSLPQWPGAVGGAQEVIALGLLLPQKPCLLRLSALESGGVSLLSPSSSVHWLMGETTQKAMIELLSVLDISA